MSDALMQFFSSVPLFSGLTQEELLDIVRGVQTVTVPAGQHLFKEGDAADALYVLQSGEMEVTTLDAEGRTILLANLGPGEVIGEVALLDGAPRSASVRAYEKSTLMRLDKAEFDFLRRNLRPAAFKIIRRICLTCCSRLRSINAHLERLLADEEALAAQETAERQAAEAKAEEGIPGEPTGGFIQRLLSWRSK